MINLEDFKTMASKYGIHINKEGPCYYMMVPGSDRKFIAFYDCILANLTNEQYCIKLFTKYKMSDMNEYGLGTNSKSYKKSYDLKLFEEDLKDALKNLKQTRLQNKMERIKHDF